MITMIGLRYDSHECWLGQAIAVLEGSTAVTKTIYIGSYYEYQIVETLTSTVATTRTYYFAGSTRVAMRDNGTLIFLLSDHLGSTSLTTDASGGVRSVQKYMPYGEVRGVGGLETDYTFTGQRSIAALGIMNYRARHYDPALGRFLEADMIVPGMGIAMAFDRYMYVFGNSLRYVDPSGHNPECGPDGVFCDPHAEFEDQYWMVRFTGEMEKWTLTNLNAAKAAVKAVGAALGTVLQNNAPFAFMTVFGFINFEWKTDCYYCRAKEVIELCGNSFDGLCAASGAVTLGRHHIMISSLSSHSNDQRDFLRRRNNIVHELGHAFDQSIGRAGRAAVTGDWAMLNRNLDRKGCKYDQYCGFTSPLNVRDWVQNSANENYEIFADMFLGWTFGMWEDHERGDQRNVWMTTKMDEWIP